MGKATINCLYNGTVITVGHALELKEQSERRGGEPPEFVCTECNEAVRPIRERNDGSVAAHVQHVKINPDCPLSPSSHKEPAAARKAGRSPNEDHSATNSIRLILDNEDVFIPETKFKWLDSDGIQRRKDAKLEVVTFAWDASKWWKWSVANPEGFVFTRQDTRRSRNFLVMHIAQCPLIEQGEMLHGSRNTKNKFMICANNLESLQAYAVYINDPMVRGTGPFRGKAGNIRACTKCNELEYSGISQSDKDEIHLLDVPFVSLDIEDPDDVADIQTRSHDDSLQSSESVLGMDLLAEELANTDIYAEGATRIIKVNAYERNPKARAACLQHHGCICKACGFDFEEAYGEFAHGFIHVHHLVPLHTIREWYEVDPIRDLVPVCPNCHAAIHLGGVTRSIEEIRAALRDQKNKARRPRE